MLPIVEKSLEPLQNVLAIEEDKTKTQKTGSHKLLRVVRQRCEIFDIFFDTVAIVSSEFCISETNSRIIVLIEQFRPKAFPNL